MPGLQSTFLAMDTEEGVEAVWNELQFTDKKAFKAQEEKIKTMFEQLVVVDHPNIVKVHKYWLDVNESQAQAWKRWCTQILSALSYLHSCDPPIIHGNLTSDTIFIQHNGLIKIGSVWHRVFAKAIPPELHSPARTEREDPRNLHFFPPEYGHSADGPAVDIFSFGMCALEMAVLEIQSNGDTSVTKEAIEQARHSLDDPNMREFILGCLLPNPDKRPTAHNLLFHRVLFEVHSLKLLAAHCFITHQYLWPENVVEEKTKELDLSEVMAEIQRAGRLPVQWRYSEVSFLELDKFLEDVRNGIYPLMNFATIRPHTLPRSSSQPLEDPQKVQTPTPEPFDVETRKVVQMQCNMEWQEEQQQWHVRMAQNLWALLAEEDQARHPWERPAFKVPFGPVGCKLPAGGGGCEQLRIGRVVPASRSDELRAGRSGAVPPGPSSALGRVCGRVNAGLEGLWVWGHTAPSTLSGETKIILRSWLIFEIVLKTTRTTSPAYIHFPKNASLAV
ncbi:nuclear receptor-binding protein 2 isoform X1 [Python bivittatus]|uniref:Nuclear receptor-binding protein 2 isoform X1 n=1 Tax=Python bivittatus TaxID=176946 RepID=A0A9F5N7I0_PYTBI|nr:nuclear receptor-binding protein 2 isoform X1 [Python bivittatus]